MEKALLFCYGTLCEPDYVQLLLQRIPEYEPARLGDYGLFVHPANEYLFIKPVAGARVILSLLCGVYECFFLLYMGAVL